MPFVLDQVNMTLILDLHVKIGGCDLSYRVLGGSDWFILLENEDKHNFFFPIASVQYQLVPKSVMQSGCKIEIKYNLESQCETILSCDNNACLNALHYRK